MYIRSSQELADGLTQGHIKGHPLSTFCSAFFPSNRKAAFELAEFAWNNISMYRSGMERILSYFLTDVDIQGVDGDERDYWDVLLNDRVDIHNKMKCIGEDKYIYGNSFTSIIFPFTRTIQCKKCSIVVEGEYTDYRIEDGKFVWKCKKCNHEGEVDIDDRYHADPQEVYVMRWNPHEMEIQNFNPVTKQADYFWVIPDHVRENINESGPLLTQLPKSMVEAASKGEDFKFHPDAIMHLKFEGPAGVQAKTKGWGVPPILSIFSDLWFRQLINKFNQAQAFDGLYPMRVLTPAVRGQSQDSTGQWEDNTMGAGAGGMNMMMNRLEELVSSYKSNPLNWHALGFPVHYGAMGGEGGQMINPELMKYLDSQLLSGIGVPVEFFEANLQFQATPESMRVLERYWAHHPSNMNSWLSWFIRRVSLVLAKKEVVARLQPPSIQDELMRRQMLIQLNQVGKLSDEAAYSPWNIDFKSDVENQIQELRRRLDLEARMNEEFTAEERAFLFGQPQPEGEPGAEAGGMPMGPGGGAPGQTNDIQELTLQAQQLAEELLQVPDPVRNSELRRLKKDDPTLHALVTQNIEDTRADVDREGAMRQRSEMGMM